MQIKTLTLGDFQTNCYLVYREENPQCVVIDPGYQPDEILLAAKALHKDICAIFLTHGHFDHVGAVAALQEKTGCKVYICPEDCAMPPRLTAGPIRYTHTYEEGTLLEEAGIPFRVLHTPGHTPGSVCLLAEDALFTGDTLFAGSCGRTDLPGGSWTQIHTSLSRLADLTGNYAVYPGHGSASSLDTERQFNPYMQ